MKTLYISDLDGTLLNKDVKLSEFSKKTLNDLISNGVSFTVATARSPISVREIFADVELKLPCILMNGVICYDLKTGGFIDVQTVSEYAFDEIMRLSKSFGLSPFVYCAHNNTLTTYYEDITPKPMQDFYNERKSKYGKALVHTDRLDDIRDKSVIYFTYLSEYSKLEPLYKGLSNVAGISCAFYKDIYAEDLWYLEVFSNKATKYNASIEIKKKYGFDTLVGYGDSLNDVPLFKACDKCFAVSDACDELKAIADSVIGSNEEDSVVKHIMKMQNEY